MNRGVVVRPAGLVVEARRVFAAAKRRGLIVPPATCSKCGRVGAKKGSGRIHGHHEDYTKPLEVVWLCTGCHSARHDELGTLRSRPRCIDCGRLIMQHIIDNGGIQEADGGFRHLRCRPRYAA